MCDTCDFISAQNPLRFIKGCIVHVTTHLRYSKRKVENRNLPFVQTVREFSMERLLHLILAKSNANGDFGVGVMEIWRIVLRNDGENGKFLLSYGEPLLAGDCESECEPRIGDLSCVTNAGISR
jgi:hypothetical protein